MATYRKRTTQEKLSAVLDGLKRGVLHRRYALNMASAAPQYYRWRDEALDAIKTIFEKQAHQKST